MIISSVIYFTFSNKINFRTLIKKTKKNNINKFFYFIYIWNIFLYTQKKDSANGRLLIRKVSYNMFKENPLLGNGVNSFQAHYMDYQAKYFKDNPTSKYSQLADNTKHPFNEFIKIGVEYGVVGLLIVFSVIFFVIQLSLKNKHKAIISRL